MRQARAAVHQGPAQCRVMQQDDLRLNMLKRHPRGVLRSLKVGARTMWAKATGKNLVGMGRALIAPLRVGLQKAGVPVRLTPRSPTCTSRTVRCAVSTSAIRSTRIGEPELIRARRGVILGSGGFEKNEQMREKYQPHRSPSTGRSAPSPTPAAASSPATRPAPRLDLMDDAWWGPTIPLPGGPWFAWPSATCPARSSSTRPASGS